MNWESKLKVNSLRVRLRENTLHQRQRVMSHDSTGGCLWLPSYIPSEMTPQQKIKDKQLGPFHIYSFHKFLES